jgi:hypothetical protein
MVQYIANKKQSISCVIYVYFSCSVNIQQTATKRVNFRLFGADLGFFWGCDLVDIANFSGEFAAAFSRVEQCRTIASSTLKKKAASLRNVPNYTALFCKNTNTCVSAVRAVH